MSPVYRRLDMKRRPYSITIIPVLCCLLFSCNNVLFDKIEQDVLMSNAPRVVSILPKDNAEQISSAAVISITFSDAMDESSVEDPLNAYVLDQSNAVVPCSSEYVSSTRTLTLTPTAYLNEGSTFSVHIASAVMNIHGVSLSQDRIWTFSTAMRGTPEGSISINEQAIYCNCTTVNLSLTKNLNVTKMKIASDPGLNGADWENFNSTKAVMLSDYEGEQTIYAQFKDLFGQESIVYSDSIVLDRIPPAVPVISGPDETAMAKPSWSWNLVPDAVQYSYRIVKKADNSVIEGWTLTAALCVSASVALPGDPATIYVFEARSKDLAGNYSVAGTLETIVNSNQPQEPVVSYPSAYTTDPTPTWTWAAIASADLYRYSLDNPDMAAAMTTAALNFTPSDALSEGSHTLYVQARNTDSQQWSHSGYKTLIVDSVQPSITTFCINGGAPYTTSTTATLSISIAETGSGIAGMKISTDGIFDTEILEDYTASKVLALPNGDGVKTVYLRAIDNAGNISNASDTITLDTVAPVLTALSINSGATYSLSRTVTASMSCTNDPYEMEIWNSENTTTGWITYSSSPGIVFASDGLKTVRARVRDAAGNLSDWNYTPGVGMDDIYVDTIDPLISVFNINNNATYTKTLSITLYMTVSDTGGSGIQGIRISTDGVFDTEIMEQNATTRALTLPPTDGSKTVYIQAIDTSGRTSVTSDSILYDGTAPLAPSVPDLNAGDDTGTSNTDNITSLTSGLTFTGTGETGATAYLYESSTCLGSATVSGGNWSIDASLNDGSHALYAYQIDPAGNQGVSSGSITVTIDTGNPLAPSVPDLAAADDRGKSDTDNITNITTGLTLSGTGETGAVVQVRNGAAVLGSATVVSGSWTMDLSLSAGTYSITAVQTDLSGRTSVATAAFDLTIDTTVPATPSTPDLNSADDSGSSNTDNITNVTSGLTFSGTGGEIGATLQLKNGTTVLGSITVSAAGWTVDGISLSAGSKSITATQTDVAGNVSATSGTLSLTIDTTAPTKPNMNVTAFTTVDQTPTVGWSSGGGGGSGTYYVAFDNANPTIAVTATSYTQPSNLTDGTHTFYAKEIDAAGNLSAASTCTVYEVPIIPANAATGVSRNPTFEWHATSAAKYEISYYVGAPLNWLPIYSGTNNYFVSSNNFPANTSQTWRIGYYNGSTWTYSSSYTFTTGN